MSRVGKIIEEHETDLLSEWLKAEAAIVEGGRVKRTELREQMAMFLRSVRETVPSEWIEFEDIRWDELRASLEELSRLRSRRGVTPVQTAQFIFSLKEPLFSLLKKQLGDEPAALLAEVLNATTLLDKFGLYVVEAALRAKEEIISRQREEVLELSTPVVEIWSGVVALPLIGVLDSARSQQIMQALLDAIVRHQADLAILDITGVPAMDTATAQYLLKTIAAAKLMGAECIVSGVSPQIAQTIVTLGIDLSGVSTCSSMASALRLAFRRLNVSVG